MAVRSRAIVLNMAIDSSGKLIYTVPADRTLIIKSASFNNTGAAAAYYELRAGTSGANARQLMEQVNGQWCYHRDLLLIFNPGTNLYAHSDVLAATTRLSLYGALLVGAPA